jgi:hypothetical protein
MTTLENRPNTALLIVDAQNRALERAHGRDAVVANVRNLVERARREGVPLIWVQHSDEQVVRESPAWRIVAELTPGGAGPLVEKNYGDSFEDTTPSPCCPAWVWATRRRWRTDRLVRPIDAARRRCQGIRHHPRQRPSYHRGPDRMGAPSPESVIAHTNLHWAYQTAPGRTAEAVNCAEVEFG